MVIGKQGQLNSKKTSDKSLYKNAKSILVCPTKRGKTTIYYFYLYIYMIIFIILIISLLDENHPNYNAPLFLDCCALVRKAVNNLKHLFGFKLKKEN